MTAATASNPRATESKNLSVDEVLSFLQHASAGDWHLVLRKIQEDGPTRDVQTASLLRTGDKVEFFWPSPQKPGQRLVAHVMKIDLAKGHVYLQADFGDGCLTGCVLPVTMTMKIA